MSRKSVAVLDVRSDAVTVLIGERGVNNTFVFRGSIPSLTTGTPTRNFSIRSNCARR